MLQLEISHTREIGEKIESIIRDLGAGGLGLVKDGNSMVVATDRLRLQSS